MDANFSRYNTVIMRHYKLSMIKISMTLLASCLFKNDILVK